MTRGELLMARTGPVAKLVAGLMACGGLAGCGGSAAVSVPPSLPPNATVEPTTPYSPSPSTFVLPTASPTSARPTESLADQAPVKAVAAYAVALAKAVNARNAGLPALKAVVTPGLAALMPKVLKGELGLYYTGPLPVTVVKVAQRDAVNADVAGCMVWGGFGIVAATQKPKTSERIAPVLFKVRRIGTRWLVDAALSATDAASVPQERALLAQVDCTAVRVVRQTW